MVLSKLLSNSKQEENLDELETKINEKEAEIQNIRGKQQLEDLKKQKRQELKQKQKELKKKEFEQTRAGQLLGNLGDGLESLSNSIDGSSEQERKAKQSLQNISENLEMVDGDGRQDNPRAVDFFGTREPIKQDDVIGTVEVEGTVELENKGTRSKAKKNQEDPFDVNTDIDMSF
jgi:chromosome segregation ATPase